jgi:hypothetical protein
MKANFKKGEKRYPTSDVCAYFVTLSFFKLKYEESHKANIFIRTVRNSSMKECLFVTVF